VTDQRRDVATRGRRVEMVEITRVAVPLRQGQARVKRRREAARLRVRRRAHAAVSDHDGGDTALHLEAHLGVQHDRKIVVGVDVEEAGGDREAPRVERHGAGRSERGLDGGDSIAAQPEIGRRPAAPVPSKSVAPRITRSYMDMESLL